MPRSNPKLSGMPHLSEGDELSKYDVLVFGDYYLDLIFTGLPGLPELGKEIIATGFEMIPGGAFSTSVALHRLGARVGWAVDFGCDDFSRLVAGRARAEGLDDGLFIWHDRPLCSITVSASYPADRALMTYKDPEPTLPAAMKALATASARAVYLPGVYHGSLLDAGLALLRAKRMKLIMDGSSEDNLVISNPAVRRAVKSADLFMPNAAEARRLIGCDDLEVTLRELGALCPLVVIKDGAHGAYAISDGRIHHAAAIPVTPIDTTGAGDCFNAGFIKAWLEGRPIAECLRWGNVVGGLSTTERGGAARAVRLDDVQHWLGRS